MTTAAEVRHGREASRPGEIPPQGWKDVLMRVKDELKINRVSLISAGVSYYALFALIPAITALVLVYAWVNDPSEIGKHMASLSAFLPAEFQSIMTDQLKSLSAKSSASLGFGAISSLALALWSASAGCQALMQGLNIIYKESDKRSFLRFYGIALGLTFLGIIMGVLSILVIIGIPAVTSMIHFGKPFEVVMSILSWVVLLGIFSLFMAFLYRYGPDRHEAKWKWVSTGAVVASLGWAIASLLFTWYAAKFGNFNKTYGSLGGVIALLTWFYISSFVILLGAEINAEMEHQTKKDTTKGRPKPMGQREATMADTLGRSYGH